ncbi:hypothetical protein [Granulicella sp. L46]|uniref:beta strand repeat-containing protein n=1 Tax=Granulicella sp. L46 TaxID=1641865 RepID=UPI00131B6811|nr:hypothetical protein [Granulicella sp. L46]
MGGHAPIIGAEVYVFQAGQTGYASAPTNEMASGQQGTDPTLGKYVLTTAPSGAFLITGDYTCTAGHPVYVAAVGGTPSPTASLVNITSAAGATTGGVFRITFSTTTPPAVGSTVSFATGAFTAAAYTFLNGTTQTVSANTATSFSIVSTTHVTGSATGVALTGGLPNPAIVNIAVLGDCPTSGNFSTAVNGALTFVDIDEVSTTAAAYALNAFGSGFHAIGAPATNLAGIERAAANAGQLFNVNLNNVAGAGIALATTNYVGGANGIVPQTTLNTLGNILAACVDSANTATTKSDECTTLFATATNTGDTTGTKPTDISSAAFNIAAFPAGTGSQHGTFTDTLYALQGASATPFQPDLSAAPNDFGVAITYDNSLNTHVGSAESVAVDGNGQIWTTAQTDTSITLWSALGTVVNSNSDGYIYGYVSVDPSNNAWTGSAAASTGIEKFNNAGAKTNTFGNGLQSAYTVITNQSANNATSIDAYFFAGATAQDGYWFTPNGDTGNGLLNGAGPAGPFNVAGNFIAHGAIDSTGDLYLTSESDQQITRVNPSTGGFLGLGNGFAVVRNFPITTPTVTGATFQPQPEFPAIDSADNAWIPLQTIYSPIGSPTPEPGLYKVSTTGAATTYFSGTGTSTGTKIFTGANFYQAFGAAVDGNGNIWVTNRFNGSLGGSAAAPGANTIIELTRAGVAVSPSTNYTYGGILNDPLNLAIDPSGNIWVTNYGGSKVVEIIGAAAPVVTPLSTSANNGTLGQLP